MFFSSKPDYAFRPGKHARKVVNGLAYWWYPITYVENFLDHKFEIFQMRFFITLTLILVKPRARFNNATKCKDFDELADNREVDEATPVQTIPAPQAVV